MMRTRVAALLSAVVAADALRLRSEEEEDLFNITEPLWLARSEAEAAKECETPDPFRFPEKDQWRHNCVKPMCFAKAGMETDWVNIPLKQREYARPLKLAVMVMAMYNLTASRVWESWLVNANRSGLPYTFMIHTKDATQKFRSKEVRHYVLNESSDIHRTRWCKAAEAEWLLMRRALQDPAITHLAVVSGDAIPLKSLKYIYRDLAREPRTRMCMDWTHRQRAETWFVMQRADAELFLENQAFVDANFRPVHLCEEERMWMYPLVLRSWKYGMEAAPLVDECVMWTDWGTHCNEWASHVLMGNFSNVRKTKHFDALAAHPRTYFRVGKAGVQELQKSSFWWARKFAERSVWREFFEWGE
mmetsp:Transcript_76880/g.238135  ORF Transcript_76880/g.238135 Transcript_76880/m.238135 type:complete len:360 (-) Transcript_76880:30-1109(-)